VLADTNIQDLIQTEVRALLLDHDSEAAAVTADDALSEIGLNSLMLAQLLIQLESALGVDPFQQDRSITDMRTVRDLVDAYEGALASAAASAAA
jgi:acyl carrier protein